MSNPAVSDRTTQSRDDVFDVLADVNQREILRITHERSPTGVTKSDLADELAAVTSDKPLADVTDDDHQRARFDCSHRSLPSLVDAGLLEELEDDRIVTTDHWLFEDPELTAVIEGGIDEADTDFDALFSALADERRRTILTVLEDQYHSLSTETLARNVAARETGTAERDVSAERVEQVLVSLHHTHLPLLNDAGLIGYDVETETVSYEGHSSLRVGWLERRRSDPAGTGDDHHDQPVTL